MTKKEGNYEMIFVILLGIKFITGVILLLFLVVGWTLFML